MKKNPRRKVLSVLAVVCAAAAGIAFLARPQGNLIRISEVTSVRTDGEAVSYHDAMELLRHVNAFGGYPFTPGRDPVNEALDQVLEIRCEDDVRYELHYWYTSGYSFHPLHPGEDDYDTILTRYRADGTAEAAWRLDYDFDAEYDAWRKKRQPTGAGMAEEVPIGGYVTGRTTVENPVYEIVSYTTPETFEASTLYVATTTDLTEHDQAISAFHGDLFNGRGVRIFDFEGQHASDTNVWYPMYDSTGRMYFLYFVGGANGKYGVGGTNIGEQTAAIEALAAETSPETPMYLLRDGEATIYAVIGKTAYWLPGNVFEPQVEALPAIDMQGMEIAVITYP